MISYKLLTVSLGKIAPGIGYFYIDDATAPSMAAAITA
jgi:hypothetical protein